MKNESIERINRAATLINNAIKTEERISTEPDKITGSVLTEEQINNIDLIPSIKSDVNSNINKINNIYTKEEIDNKILNIQSGRKKCKIIYR